MPRSERRSPTAPIAATLLLVATATDSARADPPPSPDAARVSALVEARVASRYGLPGKCRPIERAAWVGFPLRRCRYRVGDVAAVVDLLDVGPARIARWITGACEAVAAPDLESCAERLRRHVETVSFYQFPVAGVVLEDLDPAVPGVEAYAFRDGVTVRVAGLTNGSGGQPSVDSLRAALDAVPEDALRYARLQSTTREDYVANGGTDDVGTSAAGQRKLAWLEVSRRATQAAWSAPRHELMVAWARAHRALLGVP